MFLHIFIFLYKNIVVTFTTQNVTLLMLSPKGLSKGVPMHTLRYCQYFSFENYNNPGQCTNFYRPSDVLSPSNLLRVIKRVSADIFARFEMSLRQINGQRVHVSDLP